MGHMSAGSDGRLQPYQAADRHSGYGQESEAYRTHQFVPANPIGGIWPYLCRLFAMTAIATSIASSIGPRGASLFELLRRLDRPVTTAVLAVPAD